MSDLRRFNWEDGDVVFEDAEPVEKHYLYMHDQETHAGDHGRTVANESKYLKRGKAMLSLVKKAGGVKMARALITHRTGDGDDFSEDPDDDDSGIITVSKSVAKKWSKVLDMVPKKVGKKLSTTKFVVDPHSEKNKSILTAIDSVDSFFEGHDTKALQGRAKGWLSGHADTGMAFLWAATQLAIPGDSVVLHRGMDMKDADVNRIAHGGIKLVDLDTVGHWSEDVDTSENFSDGQIMFVVKVPKQDILYSHRVHDLSFGDEEENIPMFTARPKVREFTVSPKDVNVKLVVDLEFSDK